MVYSFEGSWCLDDPTGLDRCIPGMPPAIPIAPSLRALGHGELADALEAAWSLATAMRAGGRDAFFMAADVSAGVSPLETRARRILGQHTCTADEGRKST